MTRMSLAALAALPSSQISKSKARQLAFIRALTRLDDAKIDQLYVRCCRPIRPLLEYSMKARLISIVKFIRSEQRALGIPSKFSTPTNVAGMNRRLARADRVDSR